MTDLNPFHLAIPVRDLKETLAFYEKVLECTRGRESNDWVDLNFWGHQLVLHRVEQGTQSEVDTNPVDGEQVPVPHFGVVLTMDDWQALASKLEAADTEFVIAPYIRFKGKPGEQATMFFKDPFGNALEFKAFADISQLFAS